MRYLRQEGSIAGICNSKIESGKLKVENGELKAENVKCSVLL
ncbi:MAG: hypothetical protein ACJA2C_001091 [Marinoscillum sp.]|jgi:hypothetical protein